jgi:hypothetical protein
MFAEQPEERRFLSPEEELERVLKLARIGLFDRPFVAQAVQDSFGVDPTGYELADREVKVETWTCDSGHVHKDIALIETFRKAAGREPALSLKAALDRVAEESRTEPDGSLGLMNNALRAKYGHNQDGTLSKIFVMQQVYYTGGNLTGEYQRPEGQLPSWFEHRHCDVKPQHS